MTNSSLEIGPVLLSGASGMLGGPIHGALQHRGLDVLRLTRRAPAGTGELFWDPSPGGGIPEIGRLEGVSAAIHLSGANLANHRWTDDFKRVLTESRVGSTEMLARALAGLKRPPKVLITASAVGFYGNRGDEILDEDSTPGQGFLAELCAAWEAANQPALDAGIRVVYLRFGIVLGSGPNGQPRGALGKMLPLIRLGLGGRLGSGRQWQSWISATDAVGAVLFAMQNPGLEGAVNLVSPHPVTNAAFTHELARAVHRPAILPAPAFALRLAIGEMADEALLSSTRALPKRLIGAGFEFAHPVLAAALADALGTS